jgi:hypothetical protein
VPDHSTFSKNRHGRFRDSDLLRQLFETTVKRCIAEGLVGGDGFAVDGSLIRADANRQHFHAGEDGLPSDLSSRAVDEYLAALDDAAFGAASMPAAACPLTRLGSARASSGECVPGLPKVTAWRHSVGANAEAAIVQRDRPGQRRHGVSASTQALAAD